ncbi:MULTISPECIES: O-antigen ligase family protein [Bhargavaea]|uniref:O-antigen ligase family protein n=1 Tax=Bhargavaea changchunensis TaxID=2134037 RepID=A0ABW2ND49_9BACL|nr:O-antigen ligase family protein [Bhargavaea sp. CC-171006]
MSNTPNPGESPEQLTDEIHQAPKRKLAIDPFIMLLFALIMLQTFGVFSSSFLINVVTIGGLLFLLKPMAVDAPFRPFAARAEIPLILLFAWSYISTLIAEDPVFSLQYYLKILFPTVALLLGTLYVRRPKLLLNIVMAILAAVGTAHALYTLIGWAFGDRAVEAGRWLAVEIGTFVMDQRHMGPRLTGLTHNPNTLGIWVFFALLALLYMKRERIIKFWLFVPGVIVNASVLLLTESRGSMVALAASVVFYLVVTTGVPQRPKLSKNRLLISIIPLGALLLIGWSAAERVSARIGSGLNGRESAWSFILQLSQEHPVIGTGFGMSGTVLREGGIGIGPHSFYLKLLADTGFVGLHLFFLFLGMLAVLVVWRLRIGEEPATVLFVAAFLVALLTHQIVEDQLFRVHPIHYLFVFLTALLIRGFNIAKSTNQKEAATR